MDVRISARKCDQGTEHLSALMHPILESLSTRLSKVYPGLMQHLWIDLELSPGDADRRPAWAFRFQKRVAVRSLPTRLPTRHYENVGHYSVGPDYEALAGVPIDEVPCYLLDLIYKSTVVLETASRRLGGFDPAAFRREFRLALCELGCAGGE